MTMLDKAARAVCARVEERDDVWDDLSEPEREGYRGNVRAALQAIREASPSVKASGMLDGEGEELAASMWRDMVQKIIHEAG